jgi:hypothetical protein
METEISLASNLSLLLGCFKQSGVGTWSSSMSWNLKIPGLNILVTGKLFLETSLLPLKMICWLGSIEFSFPILTSSIPPSAPVGIDEVCFGFKYTTSGGLLVVPRHYFFSGDTNLFIPKGNPGFFLALVSLFGLSKVIIGAFKLVSIPKRPPKPLLRVFSSVLPNNNFSFGFSV